MTPTFWDAATPHGIDLNRNFPDRFDVTAGKVEPETEAVMRWLETYPFVLSANFHNGAWWPTTLTTIARTAFPVHSVGRRQHLRATGPRLLVRSRDHVARLPLPVGYGGLQGGNHQRRSVVQAVSGGMQDYNYLHSNCYEITVEQGCTKYPPASQLEGIWNANKDAMYAFMREVHRGVKGFVLDVAGNPIAGASIALASSGRPVRAAKDGDFWRLLAPGTYTISASAPGFVKRQQTVVVSNGPRLSPSISPWIRIKWWSLRVQLTLFCRDGLHSNRVNRKPCLTALVQAPAYNDDPPAELPVNLESDTEDVIYSANGIATSKS
eukprot:Em0015g273a